MAFGAVNLAGIGFYSGRRGAPSPRGENFGAAMNGRTRTDYGSISTRPVSILRAASFGAFWGVSGRFGVCLGILTVLGRVWTRWGLDRATRVRIVLHRGQVRGRFRVPGRVVFLLKNSGCPRDP